MNPTVIPLTSARGVQLLTCDIENEPNPGSVVLTQGEFGTAWQRWFTDGMWHRTGSAQRKDWAWMVRQRNLVLVYEADTRSNSREAVQA